MTDNLKQTRTYQRIYMVVNQIPSGKVATYGQIAAIVGNCTARMVGYALAALPAGNDVPWQRVINAQGKVSLRADGGGSRQQDFLEAEEVHFNTNSRVSFKEYRWQGPDTEWLLDHGFEPGPSWRGK